MECLGCMAIEEHPVTLNAGAVVCSSCPAWRLECEAREVLAKPLEKRRVYLLDVEQARGKPATEELKTAITVEWQKRKAA